MHCDTINKYVNNELSEEEFAAHIFGCPYCEALNSRASASLSILDLKTDFPPGLTGLILYRLEEDRKKQKKFDLMMIFQVASIVVAGIFLGITLGRNSNTELIMSKLNKKENFLIEYKDMHHLNIEQEFILIK